MKAGTSSSWMFSSCKSHRTDAYDWSGEDCPWILCQRFLFFVSLFGGVQQVSYTFARTPTLEIAELYDLQFDSKLRISHMRSSGFGLTDRVRKTTKSLLFVLMILSTVITRTLRSFHLTDLQKFVDSLRIVSWLPVWNCCNWILQIGNKILCT
jgi:hypothetical protein